MPEKNSLEGLTAEQRQALNLGNLTRQLLANPETRESAQRLLNKADAKLSFPELALKDEVAKIREATGEEQKAMKLELARLRAEREQEKLHAKVREAGLDLKPVVELMEKHGLAPTEANYDMAIEVLRSRAALAEPTPADVTPVKPPEVKEMWEDPVKWREREATKVLREIKGSRAA